MSQLTLAFSSNYSLGSRRSALARSLQVREMRLPAPLARGFPAPHPNPLKLQHGRKTVHGVWTVLCVAACARKTPFHVSQGLIISSLEL